MNSLTLHIKSIAMGTHGGYKVFLDDDVTISPVSFLPASEDSVYLNIVFIAGACKYSELRSVTSPFSNLEIQILEPAKFEMNATDWKGTVKSEALCGSFELSSPSSFSFSFS